VEDRLKLRRNPRHHRTVFPLGGWGVDKGGGCAREGKGSSLYPITNPPNKGPPSLFVPCPNRNPPPDPETTVK